MMAGPKGDPVISTDWVPDWSTLPLPNRLNPQNQGALSALVNILIHGVGAIVAAIFIGVASIPAGVAVAAQNLGEAVYTWMSAFIDGFFRPFLASWKCLDPALAGKGCTAPLKGVDQTSAAVQAAGLLGFLLAIVAVGAMLYLVAKGVEIWSG